MKNKIINFMVYIIVFIIILASFIIPNKLFCMQEQELEMEVYSEDNHKSHSISVEAENIYLVKAIHDIESENTEVIISSREPIKQIAISEAINQSEIDGIKSELETLEQHKIIKKENIFDESKLVTNVVKKVYQKNTDDYTIHNISLSVNNSNYQMDIEEKTGKIIKLVLNKENLCDTIEKKEIMKNYIQYLGLNIIDDWKYDNNIMESKKADISVILVEDVKNDVNILSVHTNETKSRTLIEYVDTEN